MKKIVKLLPLSAIAFSLWAVSLLQLSLAQNGQTPPPSGQQLPLPSQDQRIFAPEINPPENEEQKELELEQQLNERGNPDGVRVEETPAPLQMDQDNVPTSPESEIQIQNP